MTDNIERTLDMVAELIFHAMDTPQILTALSDYPKALLPFVELSEDPLVKAAMKRRMRR